MEEDQENNDLVFWIKEKMESVSISHCIWRVPDEKIKEKEDKYLPKLVSIGPFHHHRDDFKSTENQKWRYLNSLVNRKSDRQATKSLTKCVNALKELEPKVRKCYGNEILPSSDDLLTMLLLDGCFIIELLFRYWVKGLREKDDPFFSSKSSFFRLRCDLILLENQIPFLVLESLFNLIPVPEQCPRSLTDLALSFFRKMVPRQFKILPGKFSQDHCHLLDLVHTCYVIPGTKTTEYINAPEDCKPKDLSVSSKKLKEKGIGLVKGNSESLLGIELVEGEINIPAFEVNECTEIALRNLIAYEHFCYLDEGTKYVTSYAFLMGGLMQSEDDLRLLYRANILTNGSDKWVEILDLFTKLRAEAAKEVEEDGDSFFYRGLCVEVNKYVKPKHKWLTVQCINF